MITPPVSGNVAKELDMRRFRSMFRDVAYFYVHLERAIVIRDAQTIEESIAERSEIALD